MLFSLICLLRNFPSWDPCITPGYWAWYLNALPTSGSLIRSLFYAFMPREGIYTCVFCPPILPSATKTQLCCTSSHTRKLFSPISWCRGAAYQWKFSYYFETQSVFDPPDTIFKDNDACLILSIKFSARGDVNKKLSQKQSGTGCVTKWWYRLDEKGSEVVSLSKKKSQLSPGDKKIRFDSPPTLPSKAPLSVPRTKKGTFPEKKIRSALFF